MNGESPVVCWVEHRLNSKETIKTDLFLSGFFCLICVLWLC
jgi:hypothetical protein